jgi:hypothetical protein
MKTHTSAGLRHTPIWTGSRQLQSEIKTVAQCRLTIQVIQLLNSKFCKSTIAGIDYVQLFTAGMFVLKSIGLACVTIAIERSTIMKHYCPFRRSTSRCVEQTRLRRAAESYRAGKPATSRDRGLGLSTTTFRRGAKDVS